MSKKILLADDSVTIQKVISITFSSEDYELVIVSDGDEALQKAKEMKPDLVMADVAMPGRNGYEVCEAIKSDTELSGTPVILLAGTFEPLNDEEASRVKADDSIVKPFESQELLDKVSGLLERAEAPGAAAEEAVPGIEIAEEGWDDEDFLGLDESLEEGAKASSDVASLKGDMLESAGEEVNAKGAEFVDFDFNEDEFNPTEGSAAPDELDLSSIPDFSSSETPVEEPASAPEPAPVSKPAPAEEKTSDFSDEETFELDDFGSEEFGELEVAEETATGGGEEPASETDTEVAPWAESKEDLIEEPEENEPSFEAEVEPEGFGVVEDAPVEAAEEPGEFGTVIEDVMEPEADFTGAVEKAASEVEERAREEVVSRVKDKADLPDDQVEEIVAKVAREVIEKIAWDVVPDLAEELIIAEINKFKSTLPKSK